MLDFEKKDKNMTVIKRSEVGLLFGLGGSIKRYSLECRYEIGNGMFNHDNTTSRTNRFFCLFGYTF